MPMTSRAAQPFSLAAIIRHHATTRPKSIALRFEGREITWAALQARGAQVGQALTRAGVEPQDRIAFLDKNGLAYFDVATGSAQANVVLVALNWRLAPAELAYTINDARARVLIVGPDFHTAIEQIETQLETVIEIISLGSHSTMALLRGLACSRA